MHVLVDGPRPCSAGLEVKNQEPTAAKLIRNLYSFQDFSLVMLLNLVAVHSCDIRLRICHLHRKGIDPRAVFDFWSFTFIFHKISTLVEFPAPEQLSKVKSWLPSNFFELIPEGCPGDVPSWNWLGHKSTFLTVHVHFGKTINIV